MKVLGLNIGHDSGAALVIDGKIVANVCEERFSRVKNDASIPLRSIEYCLQAAGIEAEQLDAVCFPWLSTGALNYHCPYFPAYFELPSEFELTQIKSLTTLINDDSALGSEPEELQTTRAWIKRDEYFAVDERRKDLPLYSKTFKLNPLCAIIMVEHHVAHAAGACYTSGINDQRALCITLDGEGDGVSTGVWRFERNRIYPLRKYSPDYSIAWFYGVATEALDWMPCRDEWKLMGLAPFGQPAQGCLKDIYPQFHNGEISRSFTSAWHDALRSYGMIRFHNSRAKELKEIVEKVGAMPFAAEVQRVAEEQALNLINPWIKRENCRNLICTGGFFLNVKLNQKVWYTNDLATHWIYPDSGDGGLSVGSALAGYYNYHPETPVYELENMYHGPEFSNVQIKKILDDRLIKYTFVENIERRTAELLAKNDVIGWFQGRMEAGPRALGNRSIIMSPLKEENRDIINRKIKFRETFRPFCPSILESKMDEYLHKPYNAKYMVVSYEAKECAKQRIPAVIHIDGTARPQFVNARHNPRYHRLITEFGNLTGEYAILNTSFNVKDEPIVCNPREALKCFYDTGIDALVMGNFLIEK